CVVVELAFGLGKIFTFVVFGWWSFLERVIPEVRLESTRFAICVFALLLLVGGLQWLGTKLRRTAEKGWRIRWTLGGIAAVFLLFMSGLSAIGLFRSIVSFAETPQHTWE